MYRLATLFGFLLAFTACRTIDAALIVQVNYTGDVQYSSAFTNAAATWQSLLLGYQDGFIIARTSGAAIRMARLYPRSLLMRTSVPSMELGKFWDRPVPLKPSLIRQVSSLRPMA